MPRGPKPRDVVRLTAEELNQLQHLSRLRKAPYAEVLRARVLLAECRWDLARDATPDSFQEWRQQHRVRLVP